MRTIVIFFSVLLFSCATKNDHDELPRVEIDPGASKEYNLSELVSEVTYIKLASTEKLGQGLIKIMNRYIYYWDFEQGSIYVFDVKGNMIGKLDKRGKGPHEYLRINHFSVGDDENSIDVWDRENKKIFKYSMADFTFMDVKDIGGLPSFNMVTDTGNGYLLSTNEVRNLVNGAETNAPFLFLDQNYRLVKTFFDRKYSGESLRNQISYSLFTSNMTTNDLDEIYATVNYDNTIYQFKDSGFTPVVKISYAGGKCMDYEDLMDKTKKQQMEYFTTSGKFVTTASFPNIVINDPEIMVVNYRYREYTNGPMTLRSFIRFKNLKKEYNVKSIKNDMTAIPKSIQISFDHNDFYCSPMYKGKLVAVVDPSTEIGIDSAANIQGIGKVAYDDNPIIVLMQLK